MSVPLRQLRLCPPISAYRSAYRQRWYSSAAPAKRKRKSPVAETSDQSTIPVAGPSRQSLVVDGTQTPKSIEEELQDHPELVSRVESFLASINTGGVEPTRADLDRHRPPKHPPSTSPRYAPAYRELTDILCRSFTKEQLRGFLIEGNAPARHCGSKRRKLAYAESVVEQLWGWPNLKAVERHRKEKTEVGSETIPISASDLFLILGRDGTNLVRLSNEHEMHISLHRDPLALYVEGSRADMRTLKAEIELMKETFSEGIFDLPVAAPIPADKMQRISRLAQAYMENVPGSPGKVRICAKDAPSLAAAQRLASRAIFEIHEDTHIPMLTYIPRAENPDAADAPMLLPHHYAMYPFLSPHSVPLTMNTNGAFRIRRVGEWLTQEFGEDTQRTGGLSGGFGRILSTSEKAVDLKDTLFTGLPAGVVDKSGLSVKVSLGHILLTDPARQRASLVPPMTGAHPYSKIRKFLVQNPVKLSFVPSLPASLQISRGEQKMIHRVVYHALPAASGAKSSGSTVKMHWRRVLTLEADMAETAREPAASTVATDIASRAGMDNFFDDSIDSVNLTAPGSTAPRLENVRCVTGVEAELNLLMPDRPNDVQLTAQNTTELAPGHEPVELRTYVESLRDFLRGSGKSQPTPPIVVGFLGERYVLYSNSSVRQSLETIPCGDGASSLAVCESLLDLENGQKSVRCEVIGKDIESKARWEEFLSHCDSLSTLSHEGEKGLAAEPGFHDALI